MSTSKGAGLLKSSLRPLATPGSAFHSIVCSEDYAGNLDGEDDHGDVGNCGGYSIGGGCGYYRYDVHDGGTADYNNNGDDGGIAYSTRWP